MTDVRTWVRYMALSERDRAIVNFISEKYGHDLDASTGDDQFMTPPPPTMSEDPTWREWLSYWVTSDLFITRYCEELLEEMEQENAV